MVYILRGGKLYHEWKIIFHALYYSRAYTAPSPGVYKSSGAKEE